MRTVPGHETLPPPVSGDHPPAHHGVHHHQRHHRDHEEDDRGELIQERGNVQHGAEGGGRNLLSRVGIAEKQLN